MDATITQDVIDRYFTIGREALAAAQKAPKQDENAATIAIDMASRYIDDAQHFYDQDNWVLAYGALNYAHGWLDSAARLGLFVVTDDRLFTVDGD
jgi:hypothetical protein